VVKPKVARPKDMGRWYWVLAGGVAGGRGSWPRGRNRAAPGQYRNAPVAPRMFLGCSLLAPRMLLGFRVSPFRHPALGRGPRGSRGRSRPPPFLCRRTASPCGGFTEPAPEFDSTGLAIIQTESHFLSAFFILPSDFSALAPGAGIPGKTCARARRPSRWRTRPLHRVPPA